MEKIYIDHLGNKYSSLKDMCKTYGISTEVYYYRIKAGLSIEEALTKLVAQGKVCIDHLGNKYESITDMCKHYNITISIYSNRIAKGHTKQEALTGKGLTCRKCKDHCGNIYESILEMCRAYGINRQTYAFRIKNGWSIKDALTIPAKPNSVPETCYDHIGNEYSSLNAMATAYNINRNVLKYRLDIGWSIHDALLGKETEYIYDHKGTPFISIKQMCNYYEINYSTFLNRRKQGWSLEESLITAPGQRNTDIEDHLGNTYKSISDMALKWNQKPATVVLRLHKGWSIKDALLTPGRQKIFDHTGKEYATIAKMCAAYGISQWAYEKGMRKGDDLETILTREYKKPQAVADHNGVTYPTVKAMCAAYNIKPTIYYSRIKYGWTQKEALEGKSRADKKQGYPKTCRDHLGNKYQTIADMARAYGFDPAVIKGRLANGWTLKVALSEPIKTHHTYTDHLGNEYTTMREMCENYGIKPRLYCCRLYAGFTQEEALTLPRNMYIGEYRVAECFKRLNVKFYHDCSIKTIFIDLGISVDWNNFLTELQSKLGSAGYNWSKQKIQKLRPDFVLYTDEDNKIRGVIEFDGEQHQNFVEFFFKTIEEFYKRSDDDFVKQSFWEYMNIPMLRIRHDQIDMIDDMVQDFIDNPQGYIHNHNTYLSEEEYWSILTEQKQQLELAFAS